MKTLRPLLFVAALVGTSALLSAGPDSRFFNHNAAPKPAKSPAPATVTAPATPAPAPTVATAACPSCNTCACCKKAS